MTFIWLFLLRWARVVTGHFSPTEVAMTLVIGVACALGIGVSFRWQTTASRRKGRGRLGVVWFTAPRRDSRQFYSMYRESLNLSLQVRDERIAVQVNDRARRRPARHTSASGVFHQVAAHFQSSGSYL
jgi:hypothetical protein